MQLKYVFLEKFEFFANFATDSAPVDVNITKPDNGTDPGFYVAPTSSSNNLVFSVVISNLEEVDSNGNVVYSLDTSKNNFSLTVCDI